MDDSEEVEKKMRNFQSSTMSIKSDWNTERPLFTVETKTKAKVKCNPLDP